jgi:arylsulfatase A-like enzyme
LIIFTSDHGEHLGDHGITAKGPPGLDSCTHVPLLVSYPQGIEPGQRFDALIEAVDIAPTVLDFCGVQSPPFFQGRSFRPLLRGRSYKPRSSAYVEFKDPFRKSWKTIRTHAYKYCAFSDSMGVSDPDELLYDLREDPHELRNVAGDPAYRRALDAMRAELLRRWFTVENQYPLRSGRY